MALDLKSRNTNVTELFIAAAWISKDFAQRVYIPTRQQSAGQQNI